MRLLGFAGFCLEAVNELLQVRNLVLLLGVGGLLQLHLLGTQFFKFAVVAAVTCQLGAVDLQRDVGDGVQKLAVMADDDHRACVFFEPGFEPHQRIQVQVVGGLVQQQQVRRAHQRASELQPHTPAAGKTVDRAVKLMRLKAQPQDQRLGARLCIVVACVSQVGVDLRNGHAMLRVVVAGVAVFELQALRVQFRQSGVARQNEGRGGFVGLRHVLGHLGHAPLLGNGEIAAVFVQRAIEQGKQGGFACAIAPHQADFFTGVECDGDVVQQHLGAPAQDDIFESDHESAGRAGAAQCVALSTLCRVGPWPINAAHGECVRWAGGSLLLSGFQ